MAYEMPIHILPYFPPQSPTSMSVQISSISAKVPINRKTKYHFVEATLNGERIAIQEFHKGNELAQYPFRPPYSLRSGATLKIQIKRKHRFRKDEILIETDFTTEIARKHLEEENTSELTDRVLKSHTNFEIRLSFGMRSCKVFWIAWGQAASSSICS
ncbi:hypothetical protein BDQ12DRAFT_666689 [Crucibulum laeve]|uniref:Uncharacterized protein n=1 Tax=Crucibulum laeve TaxID=68775 RepID=A0A5C3M9E9_9AGAR|nr:hypothetical protein BDQ12DRAFT_666689 [Crucibulum laeve]